MAQSLYPCSHRPVCTAYEPGKRQGSFPELLKAKAIAEILAIDKAILVQPSNQGLVILPDGELRAMRWGFRRQFKGVKKAKVNRDIVNTREDKLHSATWRDAIEHRRCIVPVSLAYEWNGPKGRQTTYAMTRPDEGHMWIAGIWEEHPELGLSYSCLTTEPNAVMAPFHDRMLAVLTMDEIPAYLSGEMRHFEPRNEATFVREAANPRAKVESPQNPSTDRLVQGELF